MSVDIHVYHILNYTQLKAPDAHFGLRLKKVAVIKTGRYRYTSRMFSRSNVDAASEVDLFAWKKTVVLVDASQSLSCSGWIKVSLPM